MIWLALSVLCSVWLVVSFKIFGKYRIDTLQTIVVNYFVCVLTAWATTGGGFPVQASTFISSGWALCGIGALFIVTFNVVALTVGQNGLALASIMQKMSLVLTVVFSFLFYQDEVTVYKLIAIAMALTAVYLSNVKPGTEKMQGGWLFPIATLVGSGLCDIGILYSGRSLSTAPGDPSVISLIFLSAGVIGAIYALFLFAKGQLRLDARALWAGVLLGVPNYCSLYFLLKALPFFGGEGARLFPVANLSVICVGTLVAVLAFSERLNLYNILGIVLALGAIALMIY